MDRPFTIVPALTAIAIGFRNPASAYIADTVMPRVPVPAEKFGWTHYLIEEAFNLPDAEVGRTGRVQRLEFGGEQRDSSVKDYGLDSPIPYSDIEAAREARQRKVSNFDPEAHAVMSLTDTILNIREVRVATMMGNAANYAAARKIALAGTDRFDDYDNSDPIGVIREGIYSTLVVRPTDINMGRAEWKALSGHPKIVKAVKGGISGDGMVTVEQFRELFAGDGIKRVNIGDAFYNTAKPGQAHNLERAWGGVMSLTHTNPMANPQGGGITFGFTAQYGSRVAGRIVDEDIGLQGGVRVRSGERVRELIVAEDAGYLIQTPVTPE